MFLRSLLLLLGIATAVAAEFPISGPVAKPGTYRLEHDEGVIGLIVRADGLTARGCTKITVLREGGKKMEHVNLWELMAEFQPDFLLRPGDTVVIPEHDVPCIGNPNALREMMEDYLKARAGGSAPPSNWKEKFNARIGGDGQRDYNGAKRGVRERELPGKAPR